jgi:GNAT superfamily N-acetyltransferase
MIIDFLDIIKKKYSKNYNYYFDIGKKLISNILKEDYLENVNDNFIDNIINSNNIKIIFYSHNQNFSIKNNIGILIYYITQNNKEIKFYLLIFSINKKYRGCGYGSDFMNYYINYCKKYKNQYNKSKCIILHSLYSSYNFYKSLGFIDITNNKYKYKKIYQYEKYNKNILLLQLKI